MNLYILLFIIFILWINHKNFMKFSRKEQLELNQNVINTYSTLIQKAENWDNSVEKSQIPYQKQKKWEYIRQNREIYKQIGEYIKRKEQKKK
jgi:hypothetical protein